MNYGPASNPLQYACTIVPSNQFPYMTGFNTISCRTSDLSTGIGLHITVSAGGQTATSSDTLTFPALPIVERVSGCVDDLDTNSTSQCGTEGGQVITLYGKVFVSPLTIFVGGSRCSGETSYDTNTRATCVLPPGTGALKAVTVSSTGQTSSDLVKKLSYAAPSITAIESDACTPLDPLTVVNCPSHGGVPITIEGRNFGGSLAGALIGSALCQSPQQDPIFPHRKLVCTIPPGTASGLGVLLLQSGGALTESGAKLSYSQCQPGLRVSSADQYSCTACENGKMADVLSAKTCTECFPGKRANAEKSACVDCAPGFSSPQGSDVCFQCSTGKFASAPGLVQCEDCAPGSYADTAGRSICIPVAAGYFQDMSGQTVQKPCPRGYVNPTSNNPTCQACGIGRYQSEMAQFECENCPAGSIAPSSGSSACTNCTAGFYNSASGQSSWYVR